MRPFNPADYRPGSSLFIRHAGWHDSVTEYRVERVTPGGTVIAKLGGSEIRVNKRGNIVGEGSYSRRSPVSAERAAEIRAAQEEREAWQQIGLLAEKLERAARNQDAETAREIFAQIASGMEARQGQDPKGLDAKHDSPAAEGGTPKTSPHTLLEDEE